MTVRERLFIRVSLSRGVCENIYPTQFMFFQFDGVGRNVGMSNPSGRRPNLIGFILLGESLKQLLAACIVLKL